MDHTLNLALVETVQVCELVVGRYVVVSKPSFIFRRYVLQFSIVLVLKVNFFFDSFFPLLRFVKRSEAK